MFQPGQPMGCRYIYPYTPFPDKSLTVCLGEKGIRIAGTRETIWLLPMAGPDPVQQESEQNEKQGEAGCIHPSLPRCLS